VDVSRGIDNRWEIRYKSRLLPLGLSVAGDGRKATASRWRSGVPSADQEAGKGLKAEALEVRLFGRVQGVGFRYFVHERARRLGLVGFVLNLRDGGVRAYAEGARDALDVFLRELERGPVGSHIRETRIEWRPATGQYGRFVIEPSDEWR
jgi:acylphosphatase